jgi:GNAT superfamily N-acetyltransferase
MTMRLRPATAGDVPAMHRIRKSVTENALSEGANFGEDDYVPFLGTQGESWIGEYGGQMAGFGSLDRTNASIWALFTDPNFEGRGVGKAILNHMILQARSLGTDTLQLTTTHGTRAEQFYRRQGWVQTGTAPNGEVVLTFRLHTDAPDTMDNSPPTKGKSS